MPLKFSSAGHSVVISDECVRSLEARRQTGPNATEQGGQLFARVDSGCLEIVIATDVQGSRRRFSFRPNRRSEQKQINDLFGDGLHYVGDWHTHPEDMPLPSALDVEKITDLFEKSNHQLEWLVLIIVGRAHFPDGIYVGFADQAGVSRALPADDSAGRARSHS